ncbi:MAG: carbamoyltransferase HypF [Actinomycetota bacterium]|nr:carbamoyltransferase HypF [Actinomycetota bacterium]
MEVNGVRYLEVEVRGIVQGVGFRPFVYRLAESHGIGGRVTNTPEGARITAAGKREDMRSFLEALSSRAPAAAVIEDIRCKEIPAFDGGRFRIVDSDREGEGTTLVSPDLATCGDCLRELFDPNDRRYRYPFINCTNCGPRFTIMRETPYDRPATTMADFEMCEECAGEYGNPADRRFHAQPNACPRCGPRLWLAGGGGEELPGDPVREAARLLREGRILAIKGLGGFQLACDATSDEAVAELRRRKNRYAKPLAVMVADLEEAGRYCRVGGEEAGLLASPRSPIVLLEERGDSILSPCVAPGLRHQGIFLPYTPVHHLLLREAAIPLVMTSGNLSHEPIARDNAEAFSRLRGIADYYLLHDRDILVRYDDSVTRVLRGREYPVRRSRGYAPYPILLKSGCGREVLALGPELKNTFCFLRGGHAFVGQHIGDLDSRETLDHYREALAAVERIFSLRPRLVAHDLHPEYLTTALAREHDLPRVGVQHHHAHIVSCMADNDIVGEVIGVAWDGTGYGDDGTVWGGEFLVCDRASYTRRARLFTYPMPGGDICMSSLHRMALGVLWGCLGQDEAVRRFQDLFDIEDGETQALAAQLRGGLNSPLTSSAGRMFDAAAAMMGLRTTAAYEGQAACELEAAAGAGIRAYPWSLDTSGRLWEIDTRPLFRELLRDIGRGGGVAGMAGSFHAALAGMVVETCLALSEDTGLARVALSGGVFQNQVLTAAVMEGLEARGLSCYVHRRVPCNDGGVSLGQAVAAAGMVAGGAASPRERELPAALAGARSGGR